MAIREMVTVPSPEPVDQSSLDSPLERRLRVAAAVSHETPEDFARSAIAERIDRVLADTGSTVVDAGFFDQMVQEEQEPPEFLPWLHQALKDPAYKRC